jgi:hypothetical protein
VSNNIVIRGGSEVDDAESQGVPPIDQSIGTECLPTVLDVRQQQLIQAIQSGARKRVTAVTGSSHDGGRGELGDGDVIRMAIGTCQAERASIRQDLRALTSASGV